jgi:hypothetical protein
MAMASEPALFETLKASIKKFVEEDSILLTWPKAKASIAHALAIHLGSAIAHPSHPLYIDIMTAGADVVIHDRGEKLLLALVISTTYLTAAQQEQLRSLKERGCTLVFGIAFLKEKEYHLLYRVRRDAVDYYHYRKGTHTVVRLRERDQGSDEGQLLLGIDAKKRGRRAATPGR